MRQTEGQRNWTKLFQFNQNLLKNIGVCPFLLLYIHSGGLLQLWILKLELKIFGVEAGYIDRLNWTRCGGYIGLNTYLQQHDEYYSIISHMKNTTIQWPFSESALELRIGAVPWRPFVTNCSGSLDTVFVNRKPSLGSHRKAKIFLLALY